MASAFLVHELYRSRRDPFVSPLGQRDDRGHQIAALLGQMIFPMTFMTSRSVWLATRLIAVRYWTVESSH